MVTQLLADCLSLGWLKGAVQRIYPEQVDLNDEVCIVDGNSHDPNIHHNKCSYAHFTL